MAKGCVEFFWLIQSFGVIRNKEFWIIRNFVTLNFALELLQLSLPNPPQIDN